MFTQNRNNMQFPVGNKPLFHVHTYRCGHAEKIPDEGYVLRALELGATDLWFSDHAPFPGDPFRSRMPFAQLDEYVASLCALQEKYEGRLRIHIGLEAEYLPTFDACEYYHKLKVDHGIEFLLLGQHFSEVAVSQYSFSMDKDWRENFEYEALGEAIVQGIRSGSFDFVAHPDRIFCRRKVWDSAAAQVAKNIIQTAAVCQIPLEQNEASKRRKWAYWEEFWDLAFADSDTRTIHGLDAHAIKELIMVS